MKIHWQILKKPSVIIGAVILFFIVLFIMNRSGGSAAQTQTVSTGPDPATVAANSQLAMAQIAAGVQGQAFQIDYAKAQDADQTQIALATIAAASEAQTTAAQQVIAAQTLAIQQHGLDLQYQSNITNNQAQLDAMALQGNFGLASQELNNQLTMHLSDLQANSFNLQSELSHVNDVRLHGGQRLAVLQNIINQNGAVATGNASMTISNIPQVSIPNLTAAGQLA
jgi:hypothetical protein